MDQFKKWLESRIPQVNTKGRPRYSLVRLTLTGRLSDCARVTSIETSATNELHRSQGAQEEHRGDAKGVHCKPPDREDWLDARSGAGGDLSHGLFLALVERGLAFISLAYHRGLGVFSLEVRIRAGRVKGVVDEACRHEQEACQDDRRQGHCVAHLVADARNDFKKREFTRIAGGLGLTGFNSLSVSCCTGWLSVALTFYALIGMSSLATSSHTTAEAQPANSRYLWKAVQIACGGWS